MFSDDKAFRILSCASYGQITTETVTIAVQLMCLVEAFQKSDLDMQVHGIATTTFIESCVG